MTTLTGFYGLRPDSPVARQFARAAGANNGDILTGTDPAGAQWMIVAVPGPAQGSTQDRAYPVTGPSGIRGFMAGRLFGDWPADDDAAPGPELLATWLDPLTELPARAWGRYAGAVVTADGDLTLLRDPLGLAACYYMSCERGIAFSTRTASLLDLVGARREFDWEFIASFLVQQHFPTGRTSLAGVSQLLPGGTVTVAAGAAGPPRAGTFWRPVALAREPALVDAGQVADTLRRCTGAWMAGSPTVAVDLSGGLDSSAVAWAARRELRPRQRLVAHTLFHSLLNSADERQYAAAMADSVHAELRVIDAASSPVLGPPRGPLRRWDCVSMHAAELRLNEELVAGLGPDVVSLSGGGGDQVFLARGAGSPHLADHLRGRGVRAGAAELLAESGATGQPVLPLARAMFADLLVTRPGRRGRGPTRSLGVRFPTPPWLPEPFTPLPLALPREVETLPAAKQEQVVGISYWAGGVDREYRAAQNPVGYPMLSQPLVEIALAVPAHRLVDHGRDRIVLRDAMHDAMPPAVAARRIKSEYAGLYQDAIRQNFGYLRDLVLDGEGIRAGLVDREHAMQDLRRTALGCRPDPNWPLIGLIAAETWCRAWT